MALVALALIAAAVAAAVHLHERQATGIKQLKSPATTVDKVVEEFKELVKKEQE